MDSNNFRKVSSPNPYSSYETIKINTDKYNLPIDTAPDNRYSSWPAMMADGRLSTDYGNHCSQNIPTGSQYPTKRWLINNSDKIMEQSRKNQFPLSQTFQAVVPPSEQTIDCSKDNCKIKNTNMSNGIGLERIDNATPELFGTFDTVQSKVVQTNVSMVTHYFEGGRNTPRGSYGSYEKMSERKRMV